MKILHLNTFDISGGAAIAASRIHTSMVKAGINSRMLVLHKRGSDTKTFRVSNFDEKIFSPLRNKLEQRKKGITKSEYGLFSYAKYGTNVLSYDVFKEANVVYIHWSSASFLSLKEIEKIVKTGKFIVFFLHDMWHITGGCHYSFDCNKYQTHCHNCQMFTIEKNKDIAYKQFKEKLKLFEKYNNISFISASQWLTNCAKSSPFSVNKKVICIPYPLDATIFKPIEKSVARNVFNLPQDKKIICFGCDGGTNHPYKGWNYMEAALQELKNDDIKNVEAIIFGSAFNQEIANRVPFPVHFTGHLHDAFSLATLYSAIDVYVTPTLADNLPQTCLESLLCGSPIVGFNIGGIPDMVEHEKTGYLAKYKDNKDLANGIKYVLNADNYEELSKNAVEKARSLSSESKTVTSHLNFLSSL